MNALEYILTKYQHPKYKNYSNRAALKALVHTLNTQELKELQNRLKHSHSKMNIAGDLYNEAEKVLCANQPQKNESISSLLKQYSDKKSGKVGVSRPKLQDRFDKQDFQVQRRILKAFLAGTKSDRIWAYKKLRRNWDYYFIDDIKALWEKYHDKESEYIVIRFLPKDYVFENLPLLDTDENYSWLCTRLMTHPQFHFDKDRFLLARNYRIYWGRKEVEFLYILAMSNSYIEKGEATRILYKMLIEQLILHKELPKQFSERDDNYTMYRGMELIGLSDGFVPTTKWFKVIRRVLWCMGKLGLTEELIAFEEWDKRVQDRFSQTWESEEYAICISAEEWYSKFHEIVMECIPDRFRYLIFEVIEELNSYKKENREDEDTEKNPNIASFIDDFDLEIIGNNDPNKEPPF